MFFGIYLIHGLFLGAFTSVQIEGYRRHAVFSYKLELITSYLVIIFLNCLKLYSYLINLSSAYIHIYKTTRKHSRPHVYATRTFNLTNRNVPCYGSQESIMLLHIQKPLEQITVYSICPRTC